MSAGTYDGARLVDFVTGEMVMSSYYQPLLIKSLVESGGRRPALDLARLLLVHDSGSLARARRILMRWPKITLAKHGIAFYERASRDFVLPVRFDDDVQRQLVIDRCDAAIAAWNRKETPKQASQFYRVIERAGGRCQACGIPGSIRPIDVDHIVPRESNNDGKVKLLGGTRVPVNDDCNLQALCTRCNRGKRATSSYDFRPSAERLGETIVLVLRQAQFQGYDWEDILATAQTELARRPHEVIVSQPASSAQGPYQAQ